MNWEKRGRERRGIGKETVCVREGEGERWGRAESRVSRKGRIRRQKYRSGRGKRERADEEKK
jgi:hypothetical protein